MEFIYEVQILRTDGKHIAVNQYRVLEEAKKSWAKLTKNWEDSTKDHRPFVITEPNVSAFSPGLIYEITIAEIPTNVMGDEDNPYMRSMRDSGFSSSFSKYTSR